MLKRVKSNVVPQPAFWMIAALILAGLAFAGRITAQDSAMKDRIYVVTHVDTLPGNGPGASLLRQYVADSRKDKGSVRIELLDQISRTQPLFAGGGMGKSAGV